MTGPVQPLKFKSESKVINKFWIWLFVYSVKKIKWPKRSAMAYKTKRALEGNTHRITVVIEDKAHPNWYSRVELLEMFAIVRCCEKGMMWKVPEPTIELIDSARAGKL